jgi:hypothetical protein
MSKKDLLLKDIEQTPENLLTEILDFVQLSVLSLSEILSNGYRTEHKSMTPEEKQEILESYKWIKVKRYEEDETKSWEERYQELEKHHLEETIFLITKIRELIQML